MASARSLVPASVDHADSGPRRAPRARAPELLGPVVGNRYRLRLPHGQATGETICDARDLESGRRVAIRMLLKPQDPAMGLRYLAETRAAMRLCHPNIIDIMDFGRDIIGDGDPVAYLVMEYLEGENLATTLALDGPLHWTKVVVIAKEICLALSAAHAQGVVHCDIAAANCFRVLADGAPEVIKVLDFRSSRFACKRTGRCTSEPRSVEGGAVAPELLAGESFDHRVDIFALGQLMYQLTTHRMPGDDRSSAETSIQAAPFEVSPEFEAVVLKALARDPAGRHSSAQAMYDALVAVEQASRPASRLADDPLHWHLDGRVEATSTHGVLVAEGGPIDLVLPGGKPPALAPSRTTLVTIAVLILAATTAVVQTAWSLLA